MQRFVHVWLVLYDLFDALVLWWKAQKSGSPLSVLLPNFLYQYLHIRDQWQTFMPQVYSTPSTEFLCLYAVICCRPFGLNHCIDSRCLINLFGVIFTSNRRNA